MPSGLELAKALNTASSSGLAPWKIGRLKADIVAGIAHSICLGELARLFRSSGISNSAPVRDDPV